MQPVIGASSSPIGFFLSKDYNFLQGKYVNTSAAQRETWGWQRGDNFNHLDISQMSNWEKKAWLLINSINVLLSQKVKKIVKRSTSLD